MESDPGGQTTVALTFAMAKIDLTMPGIARVTVTVTVALAMLFGVFGTAAAQTGPAVQIGIVADPIRKVLEQGHFLIELKARGIRRVRVAISTFDAALSTPVSVLAPRTVLIKRSKTISVAVTADFRSELEYAPSTLILTATIRQGHRRLTRTRLTLRRRPIADTFVPAPGTRYNGLTSKGDPISFDIGPGSKALGNVSAQIAGFDPMYCGSPVFYSPSLYPDGTFSEFGQSSSTGEYDSIQGYFSPDGQAHGVLGHAARANGCSYALKFAASPIP